MSNTRRSYSDHPLPLAKQEVVKSAIRFRSKRRQLLGRLRRGCSAPQIWIWSSIQPQQCLGRTPHIGERLLFFFIFLFFLFNMIIWEFLLFLVFGSLYIVFSWCSCQGTYLWSTLGMLGLTTFTYYTTYPIPHFSSHLS